MSNLFDFDSPTVQQEVNPNKEMMNDLLGMDMSSDYDEEQINAVFSEVEEAPSLFAFEEETEEEVLEQPDEVGTFQDLLATRDGGKWEGSSSKLYVPSSSEKSGATVGTGFDIGQLDEAGLKKLNLPEATYKKLLPYISMKGDVARDYLKTNPLELTKEEVKSIDRKVVAKTIEQVKSRMDDVTAWDDMTESEKFAAIAAQHQYGNATMLPVQFGKRDWKGARANLNTWSDKTKGVGKSIASKYRGLVADIDKERKQKKR